MAQPAVCDRFKSPEGEYTLFSQRSRRFQFTTTRPPRLTLAELAAPAGNDKPSAEPELLVLFNQQDFVFITRYSLPEQEPLRSFSCASTPGQQQQSACCSHAWSAAPSDGLDLALGLTTGDVLVTSLMEQLAPQHSESPRPTFLHFNCDGGNGSGRVVGVAWLSQQRIAAASGVIHIYDKVVENSTCVQTHLKSIVSVLGRDAIATLRVNSQIAAIAASPDGASLAAACADGALRIWDVDSMQLVAGFRSFYGGLCCVAWSPCGAYVATGGEADLVELYSLAHRSVVGWGRGHTSWVSAIAFDKYLMSSRGSQDADLLRVITGGQDCQLALWDFAVSAEAISPATPPSLHPATAIEAAGRTGGKFGGSSSSTAGLQNGSGGEHDVIAACVPHADMEFTSPVRIRRVMPDPISSVLPTPAAIFMAGFSGQQRVWRRPQARDHPPSMPHGHMETQAQEAF